MKFILKNGTIKNNGLAGIYAKGNVEIDIDGITVEDNQGHGIYLEAEAMAPALELIAQIRQEIANESSLVDYAPVASVELENIKQAINAPKATKSAILAMFTTLKDKLLENGGILTGHAILHLIEKAPAIIESIHHLGV